MNMKRINYLREWIIASLIIVILFITFFVILKKPSNQPSEDSSVSLETLISDKPHSQLNDSGIDDGESIEKITASKIVVDVKGAVKYPGVFSLDADQRVINAIEEAGGLIENADTKMINFAQILEDEMYIYIPVEGEEIDGLESNITDSLSGNDLVNINKADEETLLQLNGIGPSKASEIIKYREENGPFKTIDEIINVTGIGEKTLDKIEEFIEVK